MKRISLFRHAEAADRAPGMDDLDRPLTQRGREDAKLMGAVLASRQPPPDIVLCSPSVRTRETLEYARLPGPPETMIEPAVYEASAQGLLAVIKALPDASEHTLIVGHNPGMQLLALALADIGASDAGAFEQVRKKFPKGALATFDFDVAVWCKIQFASGRLTGFTRPKELRSR